MVLFSFEEAARELASFGLTGNQARAFVALVHLKVAPVNEIAKLSKIRREEVYRMMPKLERLGLVEKILGKPRKYKSVPPKEALSVLFEGELESANRKMAELAEKRRHLLKQLKSVRAKGTIEEEYPRFVLISDRKQAFRKMATMMRKAERRIAIATPRYGVQFGYTNADVFRKAVKKGVEARILLEIDEIDDLVIKMLRDAELLKDVVELRHTDNLTSHMVIVDDAEVIVGTFLKPTAEKHTDLWTNSPAYVDVMKRFFATIWQNSVDVKSRIEYLQTGKLVERTEVIKGRDAVYESTFAVNSRAKVDKFGIVNGSAIGLVTREFTPTNIELKKKGVRVRYLTNVTDQNLQVIEEMSKQFEVKHTDVPPFGGLLTEIEAIFSWILLNDMPDAAIYSNNAEMVNILWKIAENAWDNAVDAQSRINEIRKGKPASSSPISPR